MHLAVMDTAERDHEFVAHLAAERPRLQEAEVMRVGMLAPAHQTRLFGHEAQILLIAMGARFGDGKDALVNARGSGILQAQGLTENLPYVLSKQTKLDMILPEKPQLSMRRPMKDTLAQASMLLAQIEGKLLKLERIQPNLAAKLAETLVDAFQDILDLIQKEMAPDRIH